MAVDENEAFLTAIFRRPEDTTARLVYADWLDEHDQPGGELIRVRHQLAHSELSKTKRAALAARERKVLAKCDRDWIVQLERADWKLRYLRVRPADEDAARWAKRRKALWSIPGQKAMTRALAAFEKEVGLPLPCSWKSYALACGAGYLCGDYIGVPREDDGDVTRHQREWSGWKAATEAQVDERFPYMPADVRPWIRNSVRFGTGDNGDHLVWNTSRVTDRARSEYEVVLLYTRGFDRLTTYDSFQAMWDTEVEQRRSDDGDEAEPFRPD